MRAHQLLRMFYRISLKNGAQLINLNHFKSITCNAKVLNFYYVQYSHIQYSLTHSEGIRVEYETEENAQKAFKDVQDFIESQQAPKKLV